MAQTEAPPELIKVAVDGHQVEVAQGTLVWDACEKAGVYVPVYCAHKKMEPVAVCRMCLVEIEGTPKLQPACATRVSPNMVVRTQTDQVRDFRKGNLELLLVNHPLDCPVCDRGGECDLQDFTQRYGPGRARGAITDKVHFNKAVKLSDHIYLDQERCILCWRCVRYYEEITGEREIVLQQRGVHTLVDTFEGRELQSRFQGNLPEICPVGALTHAEYRFRARPWDLRRTASICPGCSYGCNVFIDAREDQVARLVSNDNPEVDDSWLCDRGRYSFPELNRPDRVLNPEASLGGARQTVSYREAVARAAGALLRVRSDGGPEAIGLLGSPRVTNEEAFLLQWLGREVLGTPHLDHRLEPAPELDPEDAELGIAELEECSTVVVLGSAPEELAPVLTLRLFKAQTKRQRQILRVEVGPELNRLPQRLRGQAKVGVVATLRDREEARRLRDRLRRLGVEAGTLIVAEGMNARGCQDLGLLPSRLPGHRPVPKPGLSGPQMLEAAARGRLRALVLLNPDPEWERLPQFERALQGLEAVVVIAPHHGLATRLATALLPGRTIAEKAGTVTNTEGRVQRVRPAVQPRFAFPSDLRILADLGQGLGTPLPVQALAGPVFDLLATAVPAYRGTAGGLRSNWAQPA
ncbi:MAG: 2Fe-2S iron-sulfur cluster-binding protein [Candidatus Dormibacteria bacterium]